MALQLVQMNLNLGITTFQRERGEVRRDRGTRMFSVLMPAGHKQRQREQVAKTLLTGGEEGRLTQPSVARPHKVIRNQGGEVHGYILKTGQKAGPWKSPEDQCGRGIRRGHLAGSSLASVRV